MQRLNNYLLTHFPLLWNLRIHFVWPVIIVLHLLFLCAGYGSVSANEHLSWETLRISGVTASMAFLCGILVGVLWLVFYFRNNAFKQFYPLPKGRLMGEYLLIALTVFGLSSFTASFAGGAYGHLRSLTAETELVREANTINLARHFVAFQKQQFRSSGDCAYQQRDEEGNVRERRVSSVDTYSYLHYCELPVTVRGGIRNIWANDSIAKRWLYEGRRDSVELLLTQYVALAKKYRAAHRFDPVKMARLPFALPGFLVEEELSNAPFIEAVYDENGLVTPRLPAEEYMNDAPVLEALSAIDEAREGWLDIAVGLLLLYCSLGIGLIIFSFRLTQLRTWFTALIGAGIWMALFGVLGSAMRNEDRLLPLFLALTLVFVAAAIHLIGRQEWKRGAGVSLIWAMWSVPAFLPMLAAYVQHVYRPAQAFYASEERHPLSPVYDWISDNWTLINSINVILILTLVALLFIPLARKWQASPEE